MGILIRQDGEVLLARRDVNKTFGGLWEFPGGKLEPGESAEEALIRELEEELSIKVRVLHKYAPYEYSVDRSNLLFHPIQFDIESGQIFASEHEEIVFSSIADIETFEFAPPDYEAVALLQSEYDRMLSRI